jgi:hypothetical protein
MDPIRALLSKAQNLARPGQAWNTQAGSYAGGTAHAGVVQGAGSYVTWSGTTATVHTRLLLGVTGHGLGSELS